MKRSKMDHIIDEGISFLKSRGYPIDPQSEWSLEKWHAHRDKVGERVARGIGWDLTDFGSGDYISTGLLLHTESNGVMADGRPKDQPYANKLLIVGELQVTPRHHHWKKMEDIINRGGGYLQIELHNVGPDDSVDTKRGVNIFKNGIWETYAAGTIITLKPGERVRLDQNHYHKFWGKEHRGTVLVEEVSMVNDDQNDNCFIPADNVGRFPVIEEDAKPRYLLCTELPGTAKFEQLVQRYLTK